MLYAAINKKNYMNLDCLDNYQKRCDIYFFTFSFMFYEIRGAPDTLPYSIFNNCSRRNVAWMWSVAAKLTFNVYLLHMPIVYLFNFVGAYQQASGVLGLLLALPFAIVLSFFGALLFYCFVEAPLTRVCNHVFGPVLQL